MTRLGLQVRWFIWSPHFFRTSWGASAIYMLWNHCRRINWMNWWDLVGGDTRAATITTIYTHLFRGIWKLWWGMLHVNRCESEWIRGSRQAMFLLDKPWGIMSVFFSHWPIDRSCGSLRAIHIYLQLSDWSHNISNCQSVRSIYFIYVYPTVYIKWICAFCLTFDASLSVAFT